MFKLRAVLLVTIAMMLSLVAFHPSIANASADPYHVPRAYTATMLSTAGNPEVRYKVRDGDSLSLIAAKHRTTWQSVYCDNKKTIGKNPNFITAGQLLKLRADEYKATCHIVLPQIQDGTPKKTQVVLQSARTTVSPPAPDDSSQGSSGQSQSSGKYYGSSSMQECIISRESGGNPNIWNASGHYGLYQFSYSTWVAHGGPPGEFGNASVAEQNQVYYNTVAADGYSDWAPYDGC